MRELRTRFGKTWVAALNGSIERLSFGWVDGFLPCLKNYFEIFWTMLFWLAAHFFLVRPNIWTHVALVDKSGLMPVLANDLKWFKNAQCEGALTFYFWKFCCKHNPRLEGNANHRSLWFMGCSPLSFFFRIRSNIEVPISCKLQRKLL